MTSKMINKNADKVSPANMTKKIKMEHWLKIVVLKRILNKKKINARNK